jgi:hypothetical protein
LIATERLICNVLDSQEGCFISAFWNNMLQFVFDTQQ